MSFHMMTEERLEGKQHMLHYCCVPGTILEDSQMSHFTHTYLGGGIIMTPILMMQELRDRV